MSTLTNLSNYVTDYQIGEIVPVLTGSPGTDNSSPLTSGGFIECGNVYNQADYPKLYAKIGGLNASMYGTSTATVGQFLGYGNGVYFTGTAVGAVSTSTDSVTWTARTSNTASTLYAGAYGNGLYCIVGTNVSLNSTDAVAWTATTTNLNLQKVLYDGSRFVSISIGGLVYTSTNAVSWTQIGNPGVSFPPDLIYTGSKYITGGSSALLTSTDAVTWTTSLAVGTNMFSYGNGTYISIYGTDTYTSTDAVTWITKLNFFAGNSVKGIVFDPVSNKFIVSSNTAGTFYTTDGNTYSTYTQPNAYGFDFSSYATGYAFNNKVFFINFGNKLLTFSDITKFNYSDTYDASTQFYVPNYTFGTLPLTASGWTSPRTSAMWQAYIRAK